MKSNWAYYRTHIYQCIAERNGYTLLKHPNAVGWGMVNVAPGAGRPLLIPGMLWQKTQYVDFQSEPNAKPLPTIPLTAGLQIGSRCEWGTSLAEWAVLAIDDNIATIRQVRGWAAAVEFDVSVNELVIIPGTQPLETTRDFVRVA